MTNCKPKPKKPKLRKGETVWWTIAFKGKPCPRWSDKNLTSLRKQMADCSFKPDEFYKPVKIIVRLA